LTSLDCFSWNWFRSKRKAALNASQVYHVSIRGDFRESVVEAASLLELLYDKLLEGKIAEPVYNLDYFVSGVLYFFSGVAFAKAEPDGVVPPTFVSRNGLEDV